MNITENYFQEFTPNGGKEFGEIAIPLIREKLIEIGLDGIFIPHEDEWQNEYIPPAYDRLLWATGFSGSAGCALVLKESAHIFTDGRYTLQVRTETSDEIFTYHDLIENGPDVFLQSIKSKKIGYDPKLITPSTLRKLENSALQNNNELIALSSNPIDEVWINRPEKPCAPIIPQPIEFAGESHNSKIARIAEDLKSKGIDCVILTSPPSIAWAFNIRGGDVARSPLPLAIAIINNNETAKLFINPLKSNEELKNHLGNMICDENDFDKYLNSLNGKNIALDGKLSSQYLFQKLAEIGANIIDEDDPCIMAKACKNNIEIESSINAHIKDGIAMAKFLHWFDENSMSGIDEITVCKTLESFRKQSNELTDLSFDSISGAGSNGAIVHYRVNNQTNKKIEPNSLFLIDSGGQYKSGTTDITRTIAVGEPSPEMKTNFTLVLKGHIALSMVKFPPNTSGSSLDALARMALWEHGLDYDHGTGHGVGSYLGVHEGPHRISKAPNNIGLRTGMIVSNEPGYYKTGEYGIRIENLQFVTEAKQIGERKMHSFQTLTLAPIDTRLINKDLLTTKEIEWINEYHSKTLKTIGPHLEGAARKWLINACTPI